MKNKLKRGYYLLTANNEHGVGGGMLLDYNVSKQKLISIHQEVCDVTSFFGEKSKYIIAQQQDNQYVNHEEIEIISNGLTVVEWRMCGMPVVAEVKQILKDRNKELQQ